MTQRTHERAIPQQTRHNVEAPVIQVGDWAYLQRTFVRKALIDPEHPLKGYEDQATFMHFIGRVTRTPESTANEIVEVKKRGLPSQMRLFGMYTLAEVTLVEVNNEPRYEDYNDISIDPADEHCLLAHLETGHPLGGPIDLR